MIAGADGRKVCAKCQIPKEPEFFNNLRQELDGLDYYCKFCRNQITTKWRRENPQVYLVSATKSNANRRKKYAESKAG